MAYGNDFSSTQAADLSEQAARQAGLHAAMGHLLGTVQAMREQRNVEVNRGMQERQFQAALKQREYENKIQEQQQAVANRKLDIQNEVSQGYLKLGQDQLNLQKGGGTPAQIRDREFITQRAAADADQGMFESPQDILTKYPTIQPEMAQALYSHSVDARQRATDSYQFGKNAATTLNRLNEIDNEMKDAEQRHWSLGGPMGVRYSNDSDRYAKLEDEKKKLSAAKALLQTNKNFSSLVTFDPSTGNYINAASPPKFGKSDAASSQAAPPDASGAGVPNIFDVGAASGNAGAPVWGAPTEFGGATGSPDRSMVNAVPSGFGATAPASPSPAAASPGTNMAAPFYNRVNELISGGMDPVSAKRQALAESMGGPAQ